MSNVTVYVKAGDPRCDEILRYLTERNVAHTVKDVLTDPSASATLFGRLGRVVVPSVEMGGRFVAGVDPLGLAALLPKEESEQEPGVRLGAAVRSAVHPDGRPGAVEVGPVAKDSFADVAGLRPGDMIVAIGEYDIVGGASQFRTAVAARHPGSSLHLTVVRDGERHPITVVFPKDEAGETSAE